MTVHNYSNTASEATLDAPLNSSATTFTVSGLTGYPSVPFFILMDRDTSAMELMEVTGVASSTLTVVRGQGGTASTSHAAGATVEHVIPASVPQAVEQHVEATSNVHGVTGALIGADSPGTLTSKTFEGAHVHRYSASQPSSPVAGFLVDADNSTARDGFLAQGTGASTDRRGFYLTQSGASRIEAFYDGTFKVTPSGASIRPGIESTTSVRTVDLDVTANAVIGGNVQITGAVQADTASVGNLATSGTLSVGGTASLGTVNTTGTVTANALNVTNNASVAGQLTAGRVVLPSGSGSGSSIGQVRARNNQVELWTGSTWLGQTVTGATSTTGLFTGTNSTNNRVLYGTNVSDPGHPYILLASGQAEFNDVSDGSTRWDLYVVLDNASTGDVITMGLGNGFTQTAMGVSSRLTGAHTVQFVARRTLGSGSINITGFSQIFSVVQLATSF